MSRMEGEFAQIPDARGALKNNVDFGSSSVLTSLLEPRVDGAKITCSFLSAYRDVPVNFDS